MERPLFIQKINQAFRVHPVVALLGPRQCGKTTLARMYYQLPEHVGRVHYFDLEDPHDLARLADPMLMLKELTGLIIIDEVQRVPDLFATLRVLVDRPECNQQFLILGSASRDLIRQSSETLAGRIAYIELTPFLFAEVGDLEKLWLRGGFPRSYLADNETDSYEWRKNYVSTFLERDIPNLGFRIPPDTMRRFWIMLSHYHGNVFNASELGASLGVSGKSIRHYLDILSGTFMVRQLLPWFANIKKRQVKAPKIYFRDSGLLHFLLGVKDKEDLLLHPRLGASWEGAALEEIVRYYDASPEECYFWGVHSQAELDLLIVKDGKKRGFEFKYTSSPSLTHSMKIAREDLELDEFTVIFPGRGNFPLTGDVRAVGLKDYLLGGEV